MQTTKDQPHLRPPVKTSWFTVLLLIAAVVFWAVDQKRGAQAHRETRPPQVGKSPTLPTPGKAPAEMPQPGTEKKGAYEVYRNCTLVDYRNNDGDSFMLQLQDGRKAEFRLYFVDTPESAFKRYAGGETNHERIRQQAADLGGITPEQAVEIGKKGKAYTLGLLGSAPFTIHTCWDSPYHDDRYHAFVEVREHGETRWLHELLVEHGLVRMKTKPADLPDGAPASKHRDHLRELERRAKQNGTGVWGL
jgi:endonuclease YncB( thermonuclease family)